MCRIRRPSPEVAQELGGAISADHADAVDLGDATREVGAMDTTTCTVYHPLPHPVGLAAAGSLPRATFEVSRLVGMAVDDTARNS